MIFFPGSGTKAKATNVSNKSGSGVGVWGGMTLAECLATSTHPLLGGIGETITTTKTKTTTVTSGNQIATPIFVGSGRILPPFGNAGRAIRKFIQGREAVVAGVRNATDLGGDVVDLAVAAAHSDDRASCSVQDLKCLDAALHALPLHAGEVHRLVEEYATFRRLTAKKKGMITPKDRGTKQNDGEGGPGGAGA